MAFGMKDVLNGAKAVAGATSGNILQGGLGNYSEIPVEQLQQEYGMYLMSKEVIQTGFKLIRDALIFTDKRIIFTDKQGATGSKMRVESINLFSVVDVTMEGSVKNFVALVKNSSFLVRITDMTILIEKEFIYGSSKRPNSTDYYRKQHYQCG